MQCKKLHHLKTFNNNIWDPPRVVGCLGGGGGGGMLSLLRVPYSHLALRPVYQGYRLLHMKLEQ